MKLVFMGTPDFAVPTLQSIVRAGHQVALAVTQPDRPQGRGRGLKPTPVKAAAVELGIEVFQPADLREPGVTEKIAGTEPRAAVVVAFGHLLPPSLLAIPPLGCVNGHASLLPRWRGAAPIQHAILAGDKTTGVTTMLLDQGMDTGDMLLKREVPIDPGDTCATLHGKLAEVTAALIVETLAALETGAVKPQKQDDSLATCAPMIKKEDGCLDFTRDAQALHNLVRAFHPWPGAFATIKGARLKIIRAVAESGSGKTPGEVVTSDAKGIVVACGEGRLRVLELQAEGGKPLPAGEFLKGRRIEPGWKFD